MLKKESYITEFGRPAAAAGWHFLTGKEANIKALTGAVGFGYRYDEERQQYAHAAGIFLLTPDGRVARVLYGVVFESRTLKLGLTEAGEGKVGSTTDQALLFCYHYDANAGRYVVAASNLMRLGGPRRPRRRSVAGGGVAARRTSPNAHSSGDARFRPLTDRNVISINFGPRNAAGAATGRGVTH